MGHGTHLGILMAQMHESRSMAAYVIVLAALLLVVGVVTGALFSWRSKSRREVCLHNLLVIHSVMDSAARLLAIPEGQPIPQQEVTRYLRGSMLPSCPSGGDYTISLYGDYPTCSSHGDLILEQFGPEGIKSWDDLHPSGE